MHENCLLRPGHFRLVDNPILPKALLLQAELDRAAGNVDAAFDKYRKVYEDFPANPEYPRAAVAYARMLEDRGNVDDAMAVFAKVESNSPPEWKAAAYCAKARQLEKAGDTAAARDTYEAGTHAAPWGSVTWLEAAEGLGRLNIDMIFSTDRTPESKVYTVGRGDSLTSIGIKLNTTQGLLMAANGMNDPNKLHPGQNLKYTPKDFRIVIERSTCRLYLFDGEGLFKMYYVGLGKSNHETTIGQYRLGNKEKDPTWHKPGAGPIPAGDPNNELGTRWMPLVPEADGLPRDLGIHGTIRPESIGKYESMGCPRMHNAEVEELFDLVVRSTPVSIVEKYYAGDRTADDGVEEEEHSETVG